MNLVNRDLAGDEIIYNGGGRTGSPLWSPDGKSIAWEEQRDNSDTVFQIYDVASKQIREIAAHGGLRFNRFFAWMPDSSSVAATYRQVQSDQVQIGLLDLSSGWLKPITNDLNTYTGIGISADGHSLAAISLAFDSEIGFYKSSSPVALSTAKLRVSPLGMAWQEADHIAFVGVGRLTLYDRRTQAQTAIDIGELQLGRWIPSCTGGPILFSAVPKGVAHSEIFRVNPDGSGLANVTSAGIARYPQCVNGETLHYVVLEGTVGSVWSVPVAGGTPRKLLPEASLQGRPAFSRDGSLAEIGSPTQKTTDERLLAGIHDLKNPDSPARTIVVDPRSQLGVTRFSPDNRGLVYPIREKGQSSLLWQALDGGANRILTETSPVPIEDFDWSPDASQLGVLREQGTANVVLITDLGKGEGR